MIYVIGSGPSGVSVTKALLNRGETVTMIDAGIELENDKKESLKEDQNKDDFAESNLFKSPYVFNKEPIKTVYGSTFPYDRVNQLVDIQPHPQVNAQASLAKGGLSNVWGSVNQNYSSETIRKWGLDEKKFKEYYKIINKSLNSTQLKLSRQANHIFSKSISNNNKLKESGISVSRAFVSVQKDMCIYCGLCMHGCPKEIIYTSSKVIDDLLPHPNFNYINGKVLTRLEEKKDSVILHLNHINSDEVEYLTAKKVFLACGPLISSSIILRSTPNQINNKKVHFSDSTHFIIPSFMWKRFKKVENEDLHTLCQLKIKLENIRNKEAISLQVYTFMDFFPLQFKKILGPFYSLLRFFISPILDRLIVIQGHLSDKDSHSFNITLDDNKVKFDQTQNPLVNDTIGEIITLLIKNTFSLGIFPLFFMKKVSKIGKGVHFGSSFPMTRRKDKHLFSDMFGRPLNYKHIHIVDASIIPTIEAGPITSTVMANAYRIGSETPL